MDSVIYHEMCAPGFDAHNHEKHLDRHIFPDARQTWTHLHRKRSTRHVLPTRCSVFHLRAFEELTELVGEMAVVLGGV